MADLVYQIPPELRVWLILGPFIILGLIAIVASIFTKYKQVPTGFKRRRYRLTDQEVARLQLQAYVDRENLRYTKDLFKRED